MSFKSLSTAFFLCCQEFPPDSNRSLQPARGVAGGNSCHHWNTRSSSKYHWNLSSNTLSSSKYPLSLYQPPLPYPPTYRVLLLSRLLVYAPLLRQCECSGKVICFIPS